MRNVALFSVLFLIFATGPVQAAEEGVFTSGADWSKRMSEKEKLVSLIPPSILMSRYGVSLKRQLQRYIRTINRVVEVNPTLLSEDVANIFTATVYNTEPESRPAIEAMERDLRLRKAGYDPDYFPKLSLSSRSQRY